MKIGQLDILRAVRAPWANNMILVDDARGETFQIPDDMSNRHRRMIADWEAEGNTIEDNLDESRIELAREMKTRELRRYARDLADSVETEAEHKSRVRRVEYYATRTAAGLPLQQAAVDQANVDEPVALWFVLAEQRYTEALGLIEGAGTVSEVNALDPPTMVSWPAAPA